MKASVFKDINRFEIAEVLKHQIVSPDDVIIKVLECSICDTDVNMAAKTESSYGSNFGKIFGHELAGDHSCSAVFDNSKIKRFVPDFKASVSFAEEAKRVVDFFDADPAARMQMDEDWDAEMDDIIYRYTAYKRM